MLFHIILAQAERLKIIEKWSNALRTLFILASAGRATIKRSTDLASFENRRIRWCGTVGPMTNGKTFKSYFSGVTAVDARYSSDTYGEFSLNHEEASFAIVDGSQVSVPVKVNKKTGRVGYEQKFFEQGFVRTSSVEQLKAGLVKLGRGEIRDDILKYQNGGFLQKVLLLVKERGAITVCEEALTPNERVTAIGRMRSVSGVRFLDADIIIGKANKSFLLGLVVQSLLFITFFALILIVVGFFVTKFFSTFKGALRVKIIVLFAILFAPQLWARMTKPSKKKSDKKK